MRRYDLDWLRVIAFGLLIFYHVGMFFVPWDWHIKNNTTLQSLTLPMWFLNQWRLPLLFVISGMGTYFSLQRRTGKKFILERTIRLLIPFVFGMLFIIPPQVYIERLANNQFDGNYFQFWPNKAFVGTYPEGNISWHHLWFILYLFLFSLALTPLFLKIKYGISKNESVWFKVNNKMKRTFSKPIGLYLFVVPLFIWNLILQPYFPSTHALIGDWFTITSSISLFLFGYILITVKDVFWDTVDINRRIFLIVGILSFSIMFFTVSNFDDYYIRHIIESVFKVINLWSWILALFGYAARYLNSNSKVLSYSNQAVYPFYILHQTVIIIIGYYLIDKDWQPAIKASILIAGTFGISWLLYEFLISKWRLVRPLFGLKNSK